MSGAHQDRSSDARRRDRDHVDDPPDARTGRRVWHGALGVFIGALIGLTVASAAQASIAHGVLIGAAVGFLAGFLFGLSAFEALMNSWWGWW